MTRVLLILFCLSGCGPKADEPKLLETFQITDGEGAALPDSITCIAGDAIDLAIAYKPGAMTSFGDRPLQPPEKWRFRWEIHDGSGEAIDLKTIVIPEFFSYETLAMEGTENNSKKILRWVSPEKPPKELKDLTGKWGHARLPTEPGEYKLILLAYPTAYPGKDEAGFWGKNTPVYSVSLKVTAAEPGKEPVRPNTGEFGGIYPKREWKRRIQGFGTPSKELLSRNKK